MLTTTLLGRGAAQATPIDRHALVSRHNVVRTALDAHNPLQVGNGEFAFGADITGLQTFVPFNTMSHWGWHSAPLPTGQQPEEYRGEVWDTHGRPVAYPSGGSRQAELARWLYDNPRRLNLGRLGLRLLKADGQPARPEDLTLCRQELELWTGVLRSRFELEGQPVTVETCCHPARDAVAVRIRSPLIRAGRVGVFLDFPYADSRQFAEYVGDWSRPEAHRTLMSPRGTRRADFVRTLDATSYHVALGWSAGGALQGPPAEARPKALTITHAEYGTEGRWADVTAKVAGAVRENRLSLPVSFQTLGDPAPGQAKRLKLSYTLAGEARAVEVPDNETLQLQSESGRHRYLLTSSGGALEVVCAFSPRPDPAPLPGFAQVKAACQAHWPRFWQSGGAIDLSGSKDPRWKELERRIVLSQYLMAVNEAGSLPPQESGLVNNGWNGKFHLEMLWWHGAHYALWDRWPLLARSLDFYRHFLPSAIERARRQGYRGARWPKCAGPEGRESPHPIHALLLWQQPHPIFFAELEYRAHPTRATLEKWKEVVLATADFMASYAYREEDTGRYVLGPPLYVVSENTDPRTTKNPTFELGYWRFGLRVAQTWRERLGMPRDPRWDEVLKGLAPLPEEDGLYVLHEGVREMWTRWNFEHPALTGVFGWLPGDGVDPQTMRRTFDKVYGCWRFDRTWGWDFPMLAMCAARLGEPERAVELLLHPAPGFQFRDCGLATGGPFPYFPSNGGLLYAVAMMAAGWDGAPKRSAPGFPENGQWAVSWEGLKSAP